MNTIARSLDALIGPAMSRRSRKRGADAMRDGNLEFHTHKRLRRVTAIEHDADRCQVVGNAACQCINTTCGMPVPARSAKQLNIFAAQQQSLEMVNFSRLDSCVLPPSIDSMVMNIRQHAKGIDTIPESLKDGVLEEDLDLHPDDNVWRPNAPPRTKKVPAQTTPDTDILPSLELPDSPIVEPVSSFALPSQAHSHTLHFSHVAPIIEQARECSDSNDFETGWNSQVNGPLLLLACHLSRHRTNIMSIDLTNARLLKHLEPGHSASLSSKMIDLGICLQSDDKLKAIYKGIPPEADGQSRYFNQTSHEQIARKPLVISIGTQREGQSGAQADLQLGMWMKAHLARLAELRKRTLTTEDRTIWFPSLKAVGPVWHFLLARGEYNASGELTCTTIYSKHQLGDITTYHGFFQILAVLLELIDWAETYYRPWFEGWVSGDLETRQPAV